GLLGADATAASVAAAAAGRPATRHHDEPHHDRRHPLDHGLLLPRRAPGRARSTGHCTESLLGLRVPRTERTGHGSGRTGAGPGGCPGSAVVRDDGHVARRVHSSGIMRRRFAVPAVLTSLLVVVHACGGSKSTSATGDDGGTDGATGEGGGSSGGSSGGLASQKIQHVIVI